MRVRCENIDFAVVLGHSAQFGLLEFKLLFDYTKWVPNFYPDVRLLQAEACGSPSARKVDVSPSRPLFTWGLDGAEQCVVTARPSKLM